MKKWQDLAPPDDPNSWFDVDGVWPTNRGSYEAADFLDSGTTYTAASAAAASYAFFAPVTSATVASAQYVLDVSAAKIYQYDAVDIGSVITDVTGTASINSGNVQMAQFGQATICVLGSDLGGYPGVTVPGNATVYASAPGVNFATLTGAPQGKSICVQSNAVVILDTDASRDGYGISDVGDYTNWTTGEATSGQLTSTPGPIRAGVSFADCVYAFKSIGIYRMRYVGGVAKWTTELVWPGIGCTSRNAACAGATGILYAGTVVGTGIGEAGSPETGYYWFDGVNPPVLTNPLTTIPAGVIVYNHYRNMFSVWVSGAVYYFDPVTFAWGRNSTPGAASVIPMQGEAFNTSPTTVCWKSNSAGFLTRYVRTVNGAGTRYLETSKIGTPDRKILTTRATPVLRRLTDVGTQSQSMTASFFRERHDTSAASTLTLTQSSDRLRFDGLRSDNFVRLKYSLTDYDFEIDDILLDGVKAGKN